MKAVLNETFKYREQFSPFGPLAQKNRTLRYFDFDPEYESSKW
jgi:predicted NodU family carbamoyl transferase